MNYLKPESNKEQMLVNALLAKLRGYKIEYWHSYKKHGLKPPQFQLST